MSHLMHDLVETVKLPSRHFVYVMGGNGGTRLVKVARTRDLRSGALEQPLSKFRDLDDPDKRPSRRRDAPSLDWQGWVI